MGEETVPKPGTTPVTDRRPTPRGVLPKHVQAWLMAGLACTIVLIIVFTGNPEPNKRHATAPAGSTAAPDPARLRGVEERLRQLQLRAEQELPSPDQPENLSAVETPDASEDPIDAARRRRRYEGLFAPGLVFTRRAGSLQQTDTTSRDLKDEAPSIPSLDEVAQAVVRASARPLPTTDPTVVPSPTAPTDAAAHATAASTSSPRARVTDPPIQDSLDAAGPLHHVTRGTIIDAVLLAHVDGTAESPVKCLVTAPVYSLDGQTVLIPAGATLLGRTGRATGTDLRVPIEFDRLVMPDGVRQYTLSTFPGLDSQGRYGLRDRVSQHRWWSTLGIASAVGLISGASQAVGRGALGSGERGTTVVIAGGGADAAAQSTAQVMNRQLNRPPSIAIRSPMRLKVFLTTDLRLPAYEPQ